MEIMNLTADNFEQEVLNESKPVLVDFWAAWCGPCKMLSPIVDEIAEAHSEIKVCKVNVDDEGGLALRFKVMSIPTLILFKDGEVANKLVGLQSRQDIEAIL